MESRLALSLKGKLQAERRGPLYNWSIDVPTCMRGIHWGPQGILIEQPRNAFTNPPEQLLVREFRIKSFCQQHGINEMVDVEDRALAEARSLGRWKAQAELCT